MPVFPLTTTSSRPEFPLNWAIIGVGTESARQFGNIFPLLNFYDPVFIGTISTNTILDTSSNIKADITFNPSVNIPSLLDQTQIVASSTTTNDYGYIPYIIQVDGYMPLFINMYDTITANTTKAVIASCIGAGSAAQVFADGAITRTLSSNELSGKKCYIRRVVCLYELTTRPSGLNLDSSSFVGNNASSSADQLYAWNNGVNFLMNLRSDGITWRGAGSTANRGNFPLFCCTYSYFLNPLKLSTNKNIKYP